MKKAKVLTSDYNLNVDKYLYSSSMRINRNLNINEEATGLEIIELDDSVTSDSDDENKIVGRQHAWCYTDLKQCQMHNYHNINKGARERRRMKNKVYPDFMYNEFPGGSNRQVNSKGVATDSYNPIWDNIAKEDALTSNALNCFTIIKKDFDDSESSSDKENGIEITQCGDVILEPNQQNNDDHVKEIKYRKDLDCSRRTILIYSFKNRHNLGDKVTTGIKEYDEDSTSESSSEGLESAHLDSRCDHRSSSPTPPPYIPRLNFFAAATLPTVNEVTEPYQFSSENIEMCTNNKPKLSSNNTWEKRNKNHAYQEKILTESRKHDNLKSPPVASSNLINWMALSPRERKRDIFPDSKNLVVVENSISCVHEAKHKPKPDAIASASNANLKNNVEKSLDVDDVIDDIEMLKQRNNQFTIDEKGDHNNVQPLKKPRIRLERIVTTNLITDPIEKLNCDRWIGLEYEDENEPDFDINASEGSYNMIKPKETNKCASDRLHSKNMSLLKPVEWSEYLPITESIPSLHLSIPSDLNRTGRPLLKRIIRFFRCCKNCK